MFYFKNRDAPKHHEILLPPGAAESFRNCGVLWNAAEASEKRTDSQIAREVLLALPSDRGLTEEERIELAHSFAIEHFVSKGGWRFSSTSMRRTSQSRKVKKMVRQSILTRIF